MSDILSQHEIDQLLNELEKGEGSDKLAYEAMSAMTVRPYDFRTANRFPKEQIRTINIVMQNFVQLLSSNFTNSLQCACEADVLSIEELTFYEFNNALPSPVILAVVDAPPMDGSIMVQLSSETADAIVCRLFGGGGAASETKKTFTEIELAIIERVIRQILRCFEEAWAKVIKFHSHLDRIETSSQFAQIVDMNEPVAVISINVKIGHDTGIISICLPHMALEPVSKQMNTKLWYSGAQTRKVTRNTGAMERKIYGAPVEIHVIFNDTSASVRDIAYLQIGDVIQLEHKLDEPVTVKLQNIPKFRAEIGSKGSKYAIKITDIIRGEDENEQSVTGRN